MAWYSEQTLEFARDQGLMNIGFWADRKTSLDANKVTDAEIEKIKRTIQRFGMRVSVLGNIPNNHIAEDPGERSSENSYFIKLLELAGKLEVPYVGTISGSIPGMSLAGQVDEIVRVYTEKYFPICERNHVRILWEPWRGGPNIATGPVGYEALFGAFDRSPYVGLQYDPSHLVWQMMDPIQTARDFADKIYDVHLKDAEILWPVLRKSGIHPLNGATPTQQVAYGGQNIWWRWRLPGFGAINWPGFLTILMESGFAGCLNIEHEDPLYPFNNDGDEGYKVGIRLAQAYVRQFVPS
jgi:sugar phosphate isomerase/epimerase